MFSTDQVGEACCQAEDVLGDDQEVVVRPVERHGAGDVGGGVEGWRGGVPPGQVELGWAPVIAGPEPPLDWLGVVDHVEAAGAGRGVTHYVGDQGGVHLGQVVPPDTEQHVLTELLTELGPVADLLRQGMDQPAAGHELVETDLLE